MYKFLKVEGIDNVNTPLFETLQEQKAWFTSKVQVIIDDIFPPYYTNVISVSSDELDFSSDINYVELVFNGKSYYYFIESTSYVNEDVIDITLRMDTIQTYMFDIEYTNARIKRRTIKRWNEDGTINRNYIRENLGNDIMVDTLYRDYSLEEQIQGFNGWIVGKMIKETWGVSDTTVVDARFAKNNQKLYSDGSKLVILPALIFNTIGLNLSNVSIVFKKSGNDDTETWTMKQALDYIHKLQEEPNLVDLYYLPFNPFKNITFTRSDNAITITYDEDEFKIKTDIDGYRFLTTKQFELTSEGKLIDLGFRKNINTATYFDYKYCPQLIDENYIELLYGERISQTTYPLSKLSKSTLYGRSNCDVLTGFRNYWLVENLEDFDKYITLKAISTKESYIMINDVWKQYVANNKGSLYIGNTLAMARTAIGVSSAFASKGQKLYTQTGKITKKGQRVLDTTIDNELMNNIQNNVNKMFAPETLTQGNEFSNDVLANSMQEIVIVREVSNIDYVAKTYESIGYKVDEFVIGSPIFNDRKYYNYVECDEMDIRLTCLSIENALDDIKNRYYNGIRYYNLQPLLNELTKLGEICVYDNVEL